MRMRMQDRCMNWLNYNFLFFWVIYYYNELKLSNSSFMADFFTKHKGIRRTFSDKIIKLIMSRIKNSLVPEINYKGAL